MILSQGKAKTQNASLLPLLSAFTTGLYEKAVIDPQLVGYALRIGLGPILAHLGAAVRHPPYAEDIRAADLTARLLTAAKHDVLADVLDTAATIDCFPVVLKGMATAFRYYAQPHLRAMGDIDIFVSPDDQPSLEAALLQAGYVHPPSQRPKTFARHHHGVPFSDSSGEVCVEVHTRLFPRRSPLAAAKQFSPLNLTSYLTTAQIGRCRALTMSDELQLVYSSARWLDELNPERGVYPLLDIALLLRACGDNLDWTAIRELTQSTWAATVLHVVLTLLAQWGLVRVPSQVLRYVADGDPYAKAVSIALVRTLAEAYIFEARPFRRGISIYPRVTSLWAALVRPLPLWVNLSTIPFAVARSDFMHFRRRLRSYRQRRLVD